MRCEMTCGYEKKIEVYCYFELIFKRFLNYLESRTVFIYLFIYDTFQHYSFKLENVFSTPQLRT